MRSPEERALIMERLKQDREDDEAIVASVAQLQEDFDEFSDKLIAHEALEQDHSKLMEDYQSLRGEHDNLKDEYLKNLLNNQNDPKPKDEPKGDELPLSFESLFK